MVEGLQKEDKDDDSKLVTSLYGKADTDILIKITESNLSGKPRQAEITIRRTLSDVTRIVVTQEKAGAATLTASLTHFPVTGGESKLTITNPSNEQWKLSKSEGAEWLSFIDESGQVVTSGTSGLVVTAVAAANTITETRTAAITLSRTGQEDVTVDVTQDALVLQPLTASPTSATFNYLGGNFTVTINNPEYNRDGYKWSLKGLPDWLSANKTQEESTDTAQETLVLTAQVNPNPNARTTDGFTIERGGQTPIPITVTQTGAAATTVSATQVVATAAGTTQTVAISGPKGIPWTLTGYLLDGWASFSPASGDGNGTITVTISPGGFNGGSIYLDRAGQARITITLMRTGK